MKYDRQNVIVVTVGIGLSVCVVAVSGWWAINRDAVNSREHYSRDIAVAVEACRELETSDAQAACIVAVGGKL